MKKDLLSRWLALKKKKKSDQKAAKSSKYPLAYNQQSLYFLYQLYPDNPFYNYNDYYLFHGGLRIEKLIEAFQLIIDRHPVFRTRIVNEEAGPVQIVDESGELEIYRHELKSASEESAKELIISDANRPFDLSSNKQLRLSIVQYDDQYYAIGVIAHHIIVDKWSMGTLRFEVADLYRQLCQNNKPAVQPIKYSFGQYAFDQVNRSIDNELINYWLEKLEYENEPINLPYDYLRPDQPTFRGRHFKVNLGDDLSGGIKNQCKQFKVTPFVYLISLFKILLYKYTGRRSFNIGVPFSNKQNAELESIIGFFDETVILHAQVRNQRFEKFIEDVANDIYDVFNKKQVPIELLVKKLNPDRNSGINPLFQVMFIYHKKPKEPSFGNDLQFSSETLDTGVTKFDLSLFVGEDENGFSLTFEYATDLFREDTIVTLSNHFVNLVAQVIDNPGSRIDQLSLVSRSEFKEIVHDWNDTAFEFDSNAIILDEIKKQFKVSSTKVAVADANKRLTYRELDKLSGQLSNFLTAHQVNPGDIVGLHLDRSTEMIVAILGVLRAGASYLSLDPDYPENRLMFMLDDANVSCVITDQAINIGSDIKLLDINKILQEEVEKGPPLIIEPEDTAYLIFTSGSTGKPKGVAVSHANLYNSTIARNRYYSDEPQSFLLFSSFSFDSSVAGIFWTLSVGGKLVISENRLEQDMEKLGSVIKNEKVTHTLLLPGLYREILNSIDRSQLGSLKNVILAGEAIDENIPAMHFKDLENVRLFNEYGPTEATVWATVEEIEKDQGKITIGKPIGNTQVFILDNDGQPLPAGIPGEIHIGGLNVTKGYLNHPEATSEKFVESPFDLFPGMLYRTGDMAKFTREGKIDFMGRKDGQVKIRGHRIELNEIEGKINQLEQVKESVVIIDGVEGRNKRLICYYMAERVIDSDEFRSWLDRELPDFMIPQQYIVLDRFPRLPNGKLDRIKLPAPSAGEHHLEYEAPASLAEEKMAEIWGEVLKLDRVSVNANFFEIGGDSISSIRIISKARKSNFEIEPNQIFKYPTIRELVDYIQFDENTEVFVGEAPMSPYQIAWLRHEKTIAFKQFKVFRIDLSQKVVEQQIVEITSDLIQKHDALRITLPWESDDEALYFVSKKAEDHIAYCRELNQLQEIFQDDKQKPLFMLVGIRKDDQEQFHSLVLMGHPLIIDDQSWNNILVDFVEALDKRSAQEPENNQKAGFASWLQMVNEPAFQQKLDKDLRFWQEQLNGYLKDHHDDTHQENEVKRIQYSREKIDFPLSEDINSTFNTTYQELLLTVFVKTLADFHQKKEMIVWLEKNGREGFDATNDYLSTVGCFKSKFPFALKSTEEIKDLIVGTKESWRSIPNAGMGYEHLVNANKILPVPLDEGFEFQYSKVDKDSLKQFNVISEVKELTGPFNGKNETHMKLNCIESVNSIQCEFIFDTAYYMEKERRTFLEIFSKNTKDIFDFCLSSEREFSSSDFPDANLSGDDLNELLKQLGD